MLRAPSWGGVHPDALIDGRAIEPAPVGDTEPRTLQPIALVEPVARSQTVTQQLGDALLPGATTPVPQQLAPPPPPQVIVTTSGGGGGAWPAMLQEPAAAPDLLQQLGGIQGVALLLGILVSLIVITRELRGG